MNLLRSIFESIYIIYMFNYFKTDTYFAHPFDMITNNIPLLNHSEKENHICLIGNIVGFILPLWLIGRNYIQNSIAYNKFIMNGILLGSLLSNMNAFVYFLPLYLINL
jgi:hypothetical protein